MVITQIHFTPFSIYKILFQYHTANQTKPSRQLHVQS